MTKRRGVPGLGWLAVAAVAGLIHAAASGYWTLGGTWLLDTVGAFAVEMQREGGLGARAMLAAITLAKVAGAVVPWLDHRHPPAHRLVRWASWLGAAVLLLWGVAGAVGGWLGLAHPTEGASRAALWGHAVLWDPLFVLWGAALALGLWRSRPTRDTPPG